MKNKKHFFSLFVAVVLMATSVSTAYAVPYAPGETLDPACHPGDANCNVIIPSFTAGGDLAGTSTNQTVIGLQGNPVSSTTPASNQVLSWNGSAWAPANPASGSQWATSGNDISYNSGNVTVGTTLQVDGQLTKSVWRKYGQVFASAAEPSVLYEQNARLLAVPVATSVFKAWYDCTLGTCYAESLTALPGSWTVQSTPALTGYQRTVVRHYGSLYYFFGCRIGDMGHIDVFTSADGTRFTLAQANIITTGTAGAWDSLQISTGTVDYDGTTWRTLYQGKPAGGVWQMGLATATSATGPWTKYASNPVFKTSDGPGGMVGGGTSHYKDLSGNIWIWPHSSTIGDLPTDIYRYTSTDWIHWTRNPLRPVLQRSAIIEGAGLSQGQVADSSLVEANGKTYMFHSTIQNQSSGPFGVSLEIAPMPLAQLVTTDEGSHAYVAPEQGVSNLGIVPQYVITSDGSLQDKSFLVLRQGTFNVDGNSLVVFGGAAVSTSGYTCTGSSNGPTNGSIRVRYDGLDRLTVFGPPNEAYSLLCFAR